MSIDGVILPYIDAGAVLGSLAKVPDLKFVQTQSTGYDGVREAAGPGAAVANASGVHAAATAELAVGLILAKLRGIDQAVKDQQIESPGSRSAASPWPTARSCCWASAGSARNSPAVWSPSKSR